MLFMVLIVTENTSAWLLNNHWTYHVPDSDGVAVLKHRMHSPFDAWFKACMM